MNDAPRLVVPYRQSPGGDRALEQALREASRSDRELTVLIPLVVPREDTGCCGIRGEAWVSLLREAAEDEATHARGLVVDGETTALVEVAAGHSIPGIVSAYIAADDNRLLALPAGGRKGPFSRSVARRTAKALPGQPLPLGPA